MTAGFFRLMAGVTRYGSALAALLCAGALALLPGPVTYGQTQSAAQEPVIAAPIEAETGFLQSQGALPRFQSAGKVSGEVLTAALQQRVVTIPHFTGSFPFEGRTFPFTVVGKTPRIGGTTQIPTQLIAVSLLFEGFADEK